MQEVHDYKTFDDPNQPVLKRAADQRWKYALYVVTLIAALFAAAFLFTLLYDLLSYHDDIERVQCATPPTWLDEVYQYDRETQDALKRIKQSFNGTRMRDDLRVIAATVHVAGTPDNEKVGDYIAQRYTQLGYQVTEHRYDVLMTYPNYSAPNTISVESGGVQSQLSDGLGKVYGPDEAQAQLLTSGNKAPVRPAVYQVWWNGYAKNGTASGSIVYVNYCTLKDFAAVEALNVTVDGYGSLVLCRYGGLWRGSKVSEAAKRGAVGVIIYSDPQDYAPNPRAGVWPESYQMPPSGAQRGSTKIGDGDPLTPNMPSKPYVYRKETVESLRADFQLPPVPVMPVGYEVAERIFEQMKLGSDVLPAPATFKGGLNSSYVLTAGNVSFSLSVRSQWDERRRIRNICARLTGSEEPDQFVLFSNHYDAWTNGALDPGSGTVAQMEMARVLAQTVKATGWRPRRSVMFCHWDGEEQGLIGSREWVEEHEPLLRNRAVAVVNLDVAVAGTDTISPSGSPLLLKALIASAKGVASPSTKERLMGRRSVFDSWSHFYNASRAIRGLSQPLLGYPGSGSDHYTFIAYAAVPVLTFGYECARPGGCNHLYHTMYELPWTVENLYDPGFKAHTAVGQLALDVGLSVASSLVLPLDVTEYTAFVAAEWIRLDLQIRRLPALAVSIDGYDAFADSLSQAINRLTSTAASLQANALAAGRDPSAFSRTTLQQINQRLAMFERNWLNPAGVYPNRTDVRHVLLSASVHDAYAGVAIASVRDPIEFYSTADTDAARDDWRGVIEQSLSYLHYAVELAEKQLRLDAPPLGRHEL